MKSKKLVKIEIAKKPIEKKAKKPLETSTIAQINANQRSAVNAVKPS